jgi:hypothetical protein
VILTELEYRWPGALDHTEKHEAQDVFKALEVTRRSIAKDARLVRARFEVKLAWGKDPRPVVVRPPTVAEYGRGEEAAVIEQWLRARGFVLIGTAVEDEDSDSFMAVA